MFGLSCLTFILISGILRDIMIKQKSLVTLSAFVMSAFLMLATRNYVHAVSNNSKVTICHATSSATNPYTQIVVSENAIGGHFENPGTPKAGHELDLLFQGEVACPGGVNPTATPTNIPTNIPTATPTTPVQCDGECYPNPTATPMVAPTGNVEEGNIYDPCVLHRCPSATPTATPTATLTPTSTPSPASSQGGTGGNSDSGSSSSSSSNSSSSNNGSVQGATTTLAATGVFEDMFMNMVGLAGVALSGLSAVMYAKKS